MLGKIMRRSATLSAISLFVAVFALGQGGDAGQVGDYSVEPAHAVPCGYGYCQPYGYFSSPVVFVGHPFFHHHVFFHRPFVHHPFVHHHFLHRHFMGHHFVRPPFFHGHRFH